MSTTKEKPLTHGHPEVSGSEGTESYMRGVPCCEETVGQGFEPMQMCPMAGMCKGMAKPGAWGGWLLLLPGLFLVACGLLVILMPKALAWLLGGFAILMGIMFLFMGNRMRRLVSTAR